MSAKKKACLIYVAATEGAREAIRKTLQGEEFVVCEVEAKIEEAVAAQSSGSSLPDALTECIKNAELCVFLLPEHKKDDGLLSDSAEFSNVLLKRIVGIAFGNRTDYPIPLDDHADSMVRASSERLIDAIRGEEVWENPDLSPVPDRKIKNIRCQ